MMKEAIKALLAKLQQQGSPQPKPASAEDLKRAEAARFPTELLDFYRQCNPADCIELQQRIWSIDNALVENKDAVPGCALSPHGFIVFASTLCGDAYCIDTNFTTSEGKHPVVLFSHEMIDEDAALSVIQSLRVQVATSLEDFLMKFTNETLSEEPSYG
jgi:hypothetical protein